MVNKQIQKQVDRLMSQAVKAFGQLEWELVRDLSNAILALDFAHADAAKFKEAADRALLVASGGANAASLKASAVVPITFTQPDLLPSASVIPIPSGLPARPLKYPRTR